MTNNSTLITSPAAQTPIPSDARPSFETAAGYQLLNRMAEVFCASKIVPLEYRANKANCMIACNMASRMGVDPVTVMQNLYVINGKPGWSSQFLIGMWNTCKRFTPIRYEWSPDRKSCRATSMDLKTQDVIVGTTITMTMAKAEGWIDKPGSKWKTMPEQMLMYRAAAFMIRAYAAEIALGLMTVEETEDITGKHHIEYTEPAGVPTQAMLDQAGVPNVVEPEVDSSQKTVTSYEVDPVGWIFKHKNEDGSVTFSSTPPAGKGEVIDVESSPKASSYKEAFDAAGVKAANAISPVAKLPQPSAEIATVAPISDTTLSRLGALIKELSPDTEPEKTKWKAAWKKSLLKKYGTDSAKGLNETQADEVIRWLTTKVDAKRLTNWATGATERQTQTSTERAGATAANAEVGSFP